MKTISLTLTSILSVYLSSTEVPFKNGQFTKGTNTFMALSCYKINYDQGFFLLIHFIHRVCRPLVCHMF